MGYKFKLKKTMALNLNEYICKINHIIMKKIAILVLAVMTVTAAYAQSYNNIIPKPQSVKPASGTYHHRSGDVIAVKQNSKLAPEGYVLKITPKGVTIEAASSAGVFYAKQTLAQMAGDIFTDADSADWTVDCCTIKDEPRFPYRGLHMDVSRHFRSKEFVLKHIDAMAKMKLNRLHMHLTDGGGWRLQIDAYPLLTEVTAWRTMQFYNEWRREGDGMFCNEEEGYGGFYTKDDIREIVAYAEARHITVIPEIEIPGHSSEVLAVYPEFGCTGIPYECGDLCPGKEATFEFIEKVLDEVIELFPSEYIHIGGDEAGKRDWKTCPDCQKRMKEEGLKDVNELQSYMIARVERYLESKGRHIIGWDEILDGGVAPNATVMSWRTTEGGIRATELGHDAIMSPQKFGYIDAAQDKPDKEPAAFGVYLPLERMYDYNPAEGIPDPRHIIGLQANLWSEYIVSDEYAEYMYWPRALAVAEVGWTNLSSKAGYDEFRTRALNVNGQMKAAGYYVFDLENEAGNRPEYSTPVEHLALGCPVTYRIEPNDGYPATAQALTDGLRGGWSYRDDRWQGFISDIDVTVDLGEVKSVSHVNAEFLHIVHQDMHAPDYAEIQVSNDGVNFTTVAEIGKKPAAVDPNRQERRWRRERKPHVRIPVEVKAPYQHIIIPEKKGEKVTFDNMSADFDAVDARYVRFKTDRGPRGGWHFIDELVVR